ncbi:MAG: hypothetical protein GXP40_05755 [Chloroflexi bacterium]|nr:hypothetical protein [Chloroflexota bacterium]
MNASVECRSSSAYAEQPVALTWGGRRLVIEEVLSRWRTPEAIHFRVRTSDGQTFELSYRESNAKWHIQQS